jgi:hypothetical protein
MTKYYKVVGPFLQSAADISSKFKVRYIEGKFVKPSIPNTKLFVFTNLSRAVEFQGLYAQRLVYECEVQNPSTMKYMIRFNIGFSTMLMFWKNRKNKKSTRLQGRKTITSDTVLCDAIKLTKRVA